MALIPAQSFQKFVLILQNVAESKWRNKLTAADDSDNDDDVFNC